MNLETGEWDPGLVSIFGCTAVDAARGSCRPRDIAAIGREGAFWSRDYDSGKRWLSAGGQIVRARRASSRRLSEEHYGNGDVSAMMILGRAAAGLKQPLPREARASPIRGRKFSCGGFRCLSRGPRCSGCERQAATPNLATRRSRKLAAFGAGYEVANFCWSLPFVGLGRAAIGIRTRRIRTGITAGH